MVYFTNKFVKYAFLSMALLHICSGDANIQKQDIETLKNKNLLTKTIKLHNSLNKAFDKMKKDKTYQSSRNSISKIQKDFNNIISLLNQLFVVDRQQDLRFINNCLLEFNAAMLEQKMNNTLLDALQKCIKKIESSIKEHLKIN